MLRMLPPHLPWDGVWSFHAMAYGADRCRLLVRTRSRTSVPGETLAGEAAGPVLSLLTRGMLQGIKRRAEQAA
ncbi:MAG: hypothetical protein EBU23_08560 [Mycobacteriaceae bacterium]|nr:hypothetical protein [Mycobacteriaceae bacterium]